MNQTKPYYVYVLWSTARKCFYIGVTEDLNKRLRDHNSGVYKWTKGKGPWKIVWNQKFETLGDARKLERRLKKQKQGTGFYSLTGLKKSDFHMSEP